MADLTSINIIGITAYTLALCLFIWVCRIPGASKAAFYWLCAVVCLLAARFNLLLLPGLIEQAIINTVYAVCLVFEKCFLIIGWYYHLGKAKYIRRFKRKVMGASSVLCGALIVLQAFTPAAFTILFSISQAIALLFIAYMVFRLYQANAKRSFLFATSIFILYSMHWLTFPIATHYATWLVLGFLVGNGLNVITYIFYVSLELMSFQQRLLDSEAESKKLAVKAVAANKAKSEFLANMSHEIRTPMNGLLGMLSVVQRSELNDRQQRQVNVALDSGHALLAILNDILDFSKIEAGKLEVNPIECDLEKELWSVIQTMRPLAIKKSLTLTLDDSALNASSVIIDAMRVRQVLSNLLSNAIKFTQQGSIDVHAQLETHAGKTFFCCVVTDTGIGIEHSKLTRLFHAFEQEDSSTTREYGGTGLGLTICLRLCELMGGDIKVESTKGQGSTFSISIPVTVASEQSSSAKGL